MRETDRGDGDAIPVADKYTFIPQNDYLVYFNIINKYNYKNKNKYQNAIFENISSLY